MDQLLYFKNLLEEKIESRWQPTKNYYKKIPYWTFVLRHNRMKMEFKQIKIIPQKIIPQNIINIIPQNIINIINIIPQNIINNIPQNIPQIGHFVENIINNIPQNIRNV